MTKSNNQYTIEAIDSIVKKVKSLQLRDKHHKLFSLDGLAFEAKRVQAQVHKACKE